MPKIECTKASMRASAVGFRDLAGQIQRIDSQIDNIIRNIPLSTSGYARLRAQLRQVALASVTRTATKCRTIADSIDTIYGKYEAADSLAAGDVQGVIDHITDTIGRIGPSLPSDWADVLMGAVGGLIGPTLPISAILGLAATLNWSKNDLKNYSSNGLLNGFLNGLLGQNKYEYADSMVTFGKNGQEFSKYVSRESNLVLGNGTLSKNKGSEFFSDKEDKFNDKMKDNKWRKTTHKNNQDQENDSDKVKDSHNFAEKTVDVIGWEQKKEGALWKKSNKLEGKAGSLEGEVKAVSGEVHGSAGVGQYKFTDEDGKTHYGTGVHAEVGASGSVLEANGSAKLGNDDFDVHAKGDVKVLAASAEGGVTAAWTDKGPQIYAGGSAEAVAAEAGGSVGVKVLGADVGVKGSVKVGVGVSGKAGLKDGHFVCEFSASLGVGGSIGIDIDVAGITKSVSKGAKKVWDGICSSGKSIVKSLKFW